jgi:hypothetical protein
MHSNLVISVSRWLWVWPARGHVVVSLNHPRAVKSFLIQCVQSHLRSPARRPTFAAKGHNHYAEFAETFLPDRVCICNWTSSVNQSFPVAVLMLLCVIQKCSNYRGMRHVVGQGGDHQISMGKLHGKSMRYPRENLSFQLLWDATIPWACTLVGISLRENDFAFTSELNISGLYLNQRDHS